MLLPWILCGVLAIALLVAVAKIIILKRSMDEICTEFKRSIAEDTNVQVSISSGDKTARNLAKAINRELAHLRKLKLQYASGDRELKEAVTNISHDLRTPLTAINGYLDLLCREEKSEKVENYISQIKNRTESLKSLTEELFRYSVVTTMQELKPERLDLVRALEESLLSFYAVMQEKGIQPEITLPEEPVWRVLDAGATNRIFSNIISNAVKYSDGDLSVTMDERGCITFSNRAKSLSTIEVGRLFDRFYTVEASRSSTGLGLSIAKVLTERMGGDISAQYQNERLYVRLEFVGFLSDTQVVSPK
ncbi:MAG: HAMP domain-containing histidine kinase [Lachnospiraceae bacterium]|nr:HAMP domain-containing histidine kinase [Lachnospiraceae bacterium]